MPVVFTAHVPRSYVAEPNTAHAMGHLFATSTPNDCLALRFDVACPEVFWCSLQHKCW